jgi:hypothetical protein
VKKSRKAKFDVSAELWDRYRELAAGMNGADVVVALKQAGEEVWAAGIDDTYTRMRRKDQERESVGKAFDVTWLTVACIKLKEMKQGKRPKTRIHA